MSLHYHYTHDYAMTPQPYLPILLISESGSMILAGHKEITARSHKDEEKKLNCHDTSNISLVLLPDRVRSRSQAIIKRK